VISQTRRGDSASFLSCPRRVRGLTLAGCTAGEYQAPRPPDATHRVIEAIYFALELLPDDAPPRSGALIVWLNREGQTQNRIGIGNGRPRPPKLRTIDLRAGDYLLCAGRWARIRGIRAHANSCSLSPRRPPTTAMATCTGSRLNSLQRTRQTLARASWSLGTAARTRVLAHAAVRTLAQCRARAQQTAGIVGEEWLECRACQSPS